MWIQSLLITVLFTVFTPIAEAQIFMVGGPNPTHQTIQNALDDLPQESEHERLVLLFEANYAEKLIIDKPKVRFIGAGPAPSVIHYDAYAGQSIPGTNQTWGTWRSATVTVRATDVSFENINIENRFNYPYFDSLPEGHPERIKGMQAVALMLDQGSDRFTFSNGEIHGFQDTLFVLSGRSVFTDSIISGHVDFIFGAGTALFLRNEIVTRNRTKPMSTIGYLTAPSTHIETPYGLVFWNNKLTREPSVKADSMGLGRPWHPTTTFDDGRYANPFAIGQAVFLANWMDKHMKTEPWFPMGGTAKDGSRIEFQPEDARFYEWESCGPGSAINTTRRQLDPGIEQLFKPSLILGDWKPRVDISIAAHCPR